MSKTIKNIMYALSGVVTATVGVVVATIGCKDLLFEKKEVVDAISEATEEVE